jgi:hypothetical protein
VRNDNSGGNSCKELPPETVGRLGLDPSSSCARFRLSSSPRLFAARRHKEPSENELQSQSEAVEGSLQPGIVYVRRTALIGKDRGRDHSGAQSSRAVSFEPTPGKPESATNVATDRVYSFKISFHKTAAVGVQCVESLMDFSLSWTRTVNVERVLPIGPDQRRTYHSPSVQEDCVTAAAFAAFSANSNVGDVEFSKGVTDQLAGTAQS